MKDKVQCEKEQRKQQLEWDFKYLDHITELHDLQDSKKEFQRILIKDNFVKGNDDILS